MAAIESDSGRELGVGLDEPREQRGRDRIKYGRAMRWGRGTGVVLAIALTALLATTPAAAVDSDLKHLFAFEVEASNGYSIFAVASNERADGRGEVVLIVSGKQAGVVYTAPAQLTATTLEADLGALGSISLESVPAERKKSFRTQCEEGSKVSYEPQRYRGSFEFHGEEGYTEAVSAAPRERIPLLYQGECLTYDSLEVGGDDVPGAGLRLHSGRGGLKLDLTARKNGPRKRTQLQVRVAEERAGISISRQMSQWAGASAFDYDPLLRTAVLSPPAPFSGSASFHRAAVPRNRWHGTLTVDLPGRSNVPLAGSGIKTTLVAGCWAEGSRGLRC
jgi:hypothetical protein